MRYKLPLAQRFVSGRIGNDQQTFIRSILNNDERTAYILSYNVAEEKSSDYFTVY
jgi:hypothetical protein